MNQNSHAIKPNTTGSGRGLRWREFSKRDAVSFFLGVLFDRLPGGRGGWGGGGRSFPAVLLEDGAVTVDALDVGENAFPIGLSAHGDHVVRVQKWSSTHRLAVNREQIILSLMPLNNVLCLQVCLLFTWLLWCVFCLCVFCLHIYYLHIYCLFFFMSFVVMSFVHMSFVHKSFDLMFYLYIMCLYVRKRAFCFPSMCLFASICLSLYCKSFLAGLLIIFCPSAFGSPSTPFVLRLCLPFSVHSSSVVRSHKKGYYWWWFHDSSSLTRQLWRPDQSFFAFLWDWECQSRICPERSCG